MRDLLLSVAALILSFGLLLAGNSLQFTILGLRGTAEGFSVQEMGWIAAAYFGGFTIGSLLCPVVVSSAGHIRTFAAMGSVISGLALAHPMLPDPYAWMIIRFLTGFCFAGLYLVVESWLNARADNALRGRLLSIYSVCVFGGYAAGPLFVGLGPTDGFLMFVVASMLVSFAVVPVTLTRASAPIQGDLPRGGERFGLWALFRNSPLGFVGTFCIGSVQGTFLGLGPVFADATGVDADWVGLFMTVAMTSGMLAQYPVGLVSDWFDRRLVILIMTAAAAGGFALLFTSFAAIGQPGPGLLMIAAVTTGTAIFPVYAVVLAYTNDWLSDDQRVPAAASLILLYSLGSTVGSPLASALIDGLGPVGLFVFLGGTMGTLALFTLFRMTRRSSPDDQAEQVASWVANPGTVPLDPESVEEVPDDYSAAASDGSADASRP